MPNAKTTPISAQKPNPKPAASPGAKGRCRTRCPRCHQRSIPGLSEGQKTGTRLGFQVWVEYGGSISLHSYKGIRLSLSLSAVASKRSHFVGEIDCLADLIACKHPYLQTAYLEMPLNVPQKRHASKNEQVAQRRGGTCQSFRQKEDRKTNQESGCCFHASTQAKENNKLRTRLKNRAQTNLRKRNK